MITKGPSKYTDELIKTLKSAANPEIAEGQSAYMRNLFPFLGIKASTRDELIKPFLEKGALPLKNDLPEVIGRLWTQPEREFQYVGQQLCAKYVKKSDPGDLPLFEYMITSKSWWDTVDFIASMLVGNYFKYHPHQIEPKVEEWILSKNRWLQRTAILFQLKYKGRTDRELLGRIILQMHGTGEFFIDKAIGWSLRELSKTDPDWVVHFVENTSLSRLSKTEALKWFRKKKDETVD